VKFEGSTFKIKGTEPVGLEAFFSHYSLVNKFLTRFNIEKLTSADNLANVVAQCGLPHGSSVEITHNLGFKPAFVSCNGRVEFLQVISATTTSLTLKAKLLTVQIIDPSPGIPVTEIKVSDTSFFTEDDYVKIGQSVRKLRGIYSGKLVLDGNVVYDDTVKTMSLASTQVTLSIM
jgi:hypothetical protein